MQPLPTDQTPLNCFLPWLNKLEEADSTIMSSLKLDNVSLSLMLTKLSGMVADSYVNVVQTQVNMPFGSCNSHTLRIMIVFLRFLVCSNTSIEVGFRRFDAAVAIAEKARLIDPGNTEVGMVLNNVRLVAWARALSNDLFKAGKFVEASIAYGKGLKYEPSNSVLYCNRAACWSKLGRWMKAVEDCNEALRVQPNYTKALLRRAASYAKLERWADFVRDYEVLRKELPGDTEVAELLFHAQVALKITCGERISNMKFGGEVEPVTSLEQLRNAIHSSVVSVFPALLIRSLILTRTGEFFPVQIVLSCVMADGLTHVRWEDMHSICLCLFLIDGCFSLL